MEFHNASVQSSYFISRCVLTYIHLFRLDDRVIRFDFVKDEEFSDDQDEVLEELESLVNANKVCHNCGK